MTWTNRRETLSFVFTGGIVVTANKPLDDWPELSAIKTRITVVQFLPTQSEIRALIRRVASGVRPRGPAGRSNGLHRGV